MYGSIEEKGKATKRVYVYSITIFLPGFDMFLVELEQKRKESVWFVTLSVVFARIRQRDIYRSWIHCWVVISVHVYIDNTSHAPNHRNRMHAQSAIHHSHMVCNELYSWCVGLLKAMSSALAFARDATQGIESNRIDVSLIDIYRRICTSHTLVLYITRVGVSTITE